MQCLAKEATASALNGREAFVRLFEFLFFLLLLYLLIDFFFFFFYPNTKENAPFLRNRGDYFKNETNEPKMKERKKKNKETRRKEG